MSLGPPKPKIVNMFTMADIPNSGDPKLDQVVDDLGIVSLPALVEYLMAAHPNTDPYKLAAKVVRVIEGDPHIMPFDPLARPN